MQNTLGNFTFYNPTRILFGQDRIKDLDQYIPQTAKVLILIGGGSVKHNGSLDRAIQAMGDRTWDLFQGIEANPTYETLMKAVDQVKQGGFDYLLALGGGSVIDGTKFVAAASVFPGDPIDIFAGGVGKGLPVTSALPFATILTLPATGSEMNAGSVISFVEKKAKISFGSVHTYPQVSVLEPELTQTLPHRQLVNGLIDTFVHTMENYLTYPVNAKLQDAYAESILKTLIDIAPQVLEEGVFDYGARANFMWCATNALNGTLSTGVPTDWATHALGHEITQVYGVDHARTLSIVLPAMMKVRKTQKFDKLVSYGKQVWGLTGTDEEIVDQAILKTEEFFKGMGAPVRFSDLDLGAEAIDPLVDGLIRHHKTALSEHGDLGPDQARLVYQTAL